MNENMFDYEIWTDGGYSISCGKGAFAYIILNEAGEEVCRHAERLLHSTNNRCELLAIYNALRVVPMGSRVRVHSDSQYAIGVLSGEYRRNKNIDILEKYDSLVYEMDLDVRFKWVRGHSGDKYNELCDAMCVEVCDCDLDDYRSFTKI